MLETTGVVGYSEHGYPMGLGKKKEYLRLSFRELIRDVMKTSENEEIRLVEKYKDRAVPSNCNENDNSTNAKHLK